MAAKYERTITSTSGNVIPGATVKAITALGSYVTLYSDTALTASLGTTAAADDNGLVQFFAPDGTYTIEINYGASRVLLPDTELYDLSGMSDAINSIVGAGALPPSALVIPQYMTRAMALAATIPNGYDRILVASYDAVIFAGSAAYYRAPASDAEYTAFPATLKFTSANGRKFVADAITSSAQAGVVGDGATDDTERLQAYADYCGYTGQDFTLADRAACYRILQKIQFKTSRQLTAALPGTGLHFSDVLPFNVRGTGKAKVVAGAFMTSMFEFIFNTALSNIGPFYTDIRGVHFDGGGLATSCISSNFTMHMTLKSNRFDGAQRGVEYTGYGVMRAAENVFRCKYGFYLVGGGGDAVIENNDFFAASNASACVYLGYYSGNTVIHGNTFTNESGYTTAYSVQVAGSTAPTTEENRHLFITSNEFCGFPSSVRMDGKSSGNKNVWQTTIEGNHTLPFGASNPGKLLHAVDCTDVTVVDNQCNGKRLNDASDNAIYLERCERFEVKRNKFGNYLSGAIVDIDGSDNDIVGNTMNDIGKSSPSLHCIDVSGNVGERRLTGNIIRQSSSSYAQTGIYEADGADLTYANENTFRNIAYAQRKNATSASIMVKTLYGAAAPGTGTHNVGDRVLNGAPVAGGTIGSICTTAGAPGTWKAFGAISA